ncbi:MAG: YlxR family protein [Acholeplasmataceae bacterium]|nr:YlxR family protein [Acholeplasmataceae bacterium]MCK9233886.1 YlxR family protein [Acholeplasmataceae bacterium]MCK9289123.1 YlxR family protein [Acholeplasmataceae bacterium]MCK9427113.1 YlxR family protein [Acholeplasmataceae bacterium]
MMKVKKIPMRTCVVTKEVKPKKELMRVVATKEGEVFVDPSGKKNGRGAYLTLSLAVIEKAKTTKILEKRLKVKISDEIYETLKGYL